jgi:hypothetical protein
MKRATLVPVLMLFYGFLSNAATLHFKKGDWLLATSGQMFQTNGNYVGSGGASSLAPGNSFQTLQAEVLSRYSLNSTWALFAAAHFAMSDSKSNNVNRNNSSLTEAVIGTHTKLEFSAFDLIPELSYLFPFEKNNNNQDSVMSSEGVTVLDARLRGQVAFEHFNLFSHAGYAMRSGRSHLLNWELGFELPVSQSLLLGAKIYGSQSISNDPDTGGSAEASRLAATNRVNGGSYYYYSVNPSLIEAEGFAKIKLGSRWAIGGFGGLTVSGSNAAAGWYAGGTLDFLFNTEPVVRKRSRSKTQISVDPTDFSEDIDDGVDQKIFYPPPTQPTPARQQEDTSSILQQLDDMEMSIELKADKRKKKKK